MIARRIFTRFGMGLILILILSLALAACSSDGDDDSGAAAPAPTSAPAAAPTSAPSAAPTSAPAAAPTAMPAAVEPKVDRLVIAMPPPDVEGNQPNVDLGPLSIFQLRPMQEWLVGYGIDGEFEPMLAESWSVEPDGFSLRFQLRRGVQFHNDAGEFTAQDVVHSFEQITREDSIHPHARIHRRNTLEVVSDYEVVFRLTRGNAEYTNQLSRQSGSMAITSKVDFDSLGGEIDLGKRPVASTGPYQYESRDLGIAITYERVPWEHYNGTPDFPEIQMRWLPETSTRLASLLTGEIHVTVLPEDQAVQAVEEGHTRIRGPITQQRTWMAMYGVYTDSDAPSGYVHPEIALADVRVRKALNKAIDRTALNDAFFGGKAELMIIDKMPTSKPYFNPEWTRNFESEYGYDPAAARTLLAEAGFNSNNPLEMTMRMINLSDYGGSEDVQDAVAGFWSDIGVKVDQVVIEATRFRNVNREFGWTDLVTINASSNFDIQAWRVYNSHGVPRGSLEQTELDALHDVLTVTMDEPTQNDLLRQLGDTAFPLHTQVPLFWLPAEMIVNPEIVASWPYPGSISRVFSHFETIKAAR